MSAFAASCISSLPLGATLTQQHHVSPAPSKVNCRKKQAPTLPNACPMPILGCLPSQAPAATDASLPPSTGLTARRVKPLDGLQYRLREPVRCSAEHPTGYPRLHPDAVPEMSPAMVQSSRLDVRARFPVVGCAVPMRCRSCFQRGQALQAEGSNIPMTLQP